MARVTLIAGAGTATGRELVGAARAAGDTVLAVGAGDTSGATGGVGEGVHAIPWPMRSPLAPRTILLRATVLAERVDRAIVVHEPHLEQHLLTETRLFTIEEAIDAWLKAFVALTRELLRYFLARAADGGQAGGHLVLAAASGRAPAGAEPPLQAIVRQGFSGLMEAVRATAGDRHESAVGVSTFTGDSADPQRYARFILDKMETRSGGHHVFGRRGLLAGLRSS